jgi:hypothetical protein
LDWFFDEELKIKKNKKKIKIEIENSVKTFYFSVISSGNKRSQVCNEE